MNHVDNTGAPAMTALPPLLRLLRPAQWIKNGLVLTGLIFGHAWNDPAKLRAALAAMVAFCLASSFAYALNDIADRERDRLHPIKKARPIAAGEIGVGTAWIIAAILAAAALALAASVSPKVVLTLIAYALLNFAYSFKLKHIVILDVFALAAGLMLRILAGTLGIGIAPSQWLIICGMTLALFLGFTKRRAEFAAMGQAENPQRQVLDRYSPTVLDHFITLAGSGVILTYGLYTMSADTIALHHTANLIYTVPLVIYGVLRIMYRLHQAGRGEDPAVDIMRDPHLVMTFAAWLVVTLSIIV